MNTPAISTLLNGIHAPTSGNPAAKQSGTTSDTQFNQMLSRGIEQHRARQEPTKPAAKESSPTKPATQSAQSPAKTSKADSGEEGKPASVDETASAAAAEDAPASAATVEQSKTSSASGDSEDDEAAFAASSDELLALVANLTAVLPANVPVQAPAAEVVQVDADATDTGKTVLPSDAQSAVAGMAASVGKADLTAHASLTALRNRVASDATASDTVTSEKPGTKPEFELAMSEAQPRNAKVTADAGPALARSAQAELAAATASDVDPLVKTTVDTQPAATPIPSINVAPQPQVSLLQVQAAAAAAADKIAPRVGSNGWDQAVAQKVVWMVAGEQQSASLTLNPPDLGPMQVVLSVSNNEATVSFTSAQPEVRQALQDAVPKLREMLGDAGIQLGQANVSAGTPNNQQGGFGGGRQGSRGAGQDNEDSAEAPVHSVRSQTITGGGEGLVDTFA